MTLWICAAAAGGGAVGSLLRYAAGRLTASWTVSPFPWATLAVNVVGSFAIGLWAAYLLKAAADGPAELPRIALWDTAIRVGVLGGLTTFSSFSLESILLIQRGQTLLATANVAANVVLGFAAAAAGMAILR